MRMIITYHLSLVFPINFFCTTEIFVDNIKEFDLLFTDPLLNFFWRS